MQVGRKLGISQYAALFSILCCLFWAGITGSNCPGSALATVQGPEQIILNWTGDPGSTQTVTWLCSDTTASQLQYMPAAGFNGDFSTASIVEAQGLPFDSNNCRYQANIKGLTADTPYVYRVGREGAWSEPRSFSTAKDTDTFTFLYLGDVQEGYSEWRDMLGAIKKSYPQIKFALQGGDLTNKSNDELEWGEFLAAATPCFSQIPLMPTLGNHDGSMYLDFFSLPLNGPRGLEKEFYSFDYANAHFVILNSGNNTNQAAKEWLQRDLQNAEQTWKFVVFHHPAYQAFDDFKTIDDSIREHWVPIFEEGGVDMAFVGHQHQYMRTHPIFQGEISPDRAEHGVVYVMGNSGSKTYQLGPGLPYVACQEAGSNYQLITIQDELLSLTSAKAGGELIEVYTIDKGPQDSPRYLLAPERDEAYQISTNADGINTMTVNTNVNGFRYFTTNLTSVVPHPGDETVVFTHMRNGVQLAINASRADFDVVSQAQGGFNVKAGDVIKAYIVDELSTDMDRNPIILH